MKEENTDLSRRTFLSKSAAFAAGSSIIAIPALAANTKGAENSAPMLTNDPVYTDDVQTLTNKTISAANNTLIIGTDTVNIKEYSITGVDITSALNSAISALSSTGGRILIPRGVWESNGGHTVTHAISIEGVGINSGIPGMGSVVKLKTGQSSFMFKLLTPTRNVSFKNFAINLNDTPTATGILLTDIGGSGGSAAYIYSTRVENLGIYGGAYGIKVESSSTTQFECILNSFERIHFVGCRTCFYNNTVNTGFKFDNCHFYLPTSVGETPGGTALECVTIGNISLEHCLFVGTQVNDPFVPPDDGSTILKTVGLFNSISFYDCQDENVEYAYQNSTNPWNVVALVYRNCLIQSHFKFTAHGKVVLDSCRCAGTIFDSENVAVNLYLKGVWNFFSYNTTTGQQITYRDPADHVNFTYEYSHIVYENLEVNAPIIKGASDTNSSGNYVVANGTRGTATLLSGASYLQVYNNIVSANSLVFLQLRSYDSGGARIREVDVSNGYFVIYLTQNAASNLNISFLVES